MTFSNFFIASDDVMLSNQLQPWNTVEIMTFFFYQINIELIQFQLSDQFIFDLQDTKILIFKNVKLYDLITEAILYIFQFKQVHNNVVIINKVMAKQILFNYKMLKNYDGNALIINDIISRAPFYDVDYQVRQCKLPQFNVRLTLANFNNFPDFKFKNLNFKFKFEGNDQEQFFRTFEETVIYLLDEHKNLNITKIIVNTQQLSKKLLSFQFGLAEQIEQNELEFDIRRMKFDKDKRFKHYIGLQSFERDFNIDIVNDLIEIQRLYCEMEYIWK
ncbi:hypothetical protein SS50377_26849 [Spironucleus salmonicida]|nr:hypothetical protein SS50377_26849 [Spironucleus salmonicida]